MMLLVSSSLSVHLLPRAFWRCAQVVALFSTSLWSVLTYAQGLPKAKIRHRGKETVVRMVQIVAPPRRRDPATSVPENTVGFLGEPETDRLRSLASAPLAAVKKGHGGRSLAFKLTLADGTKAYFKPEQSFSGAHWYGELAAYYLDRSLGLGRVPPTVGRRFKWSSLRPAARGDARLREVKVDAQGYVRGAVVWWVEGGLVPIRPGAGWEKWVRQRGGLAITPYQRPIEYTRAMAQWRRQRQAKRPQAESVMAKSTKQRWASDKPDPALAAALSDLILFDYWTSNVDRWGGQFTNVRTRGAAGPLVFFDNGATIWPRARPPIMEPRLRALQCIRRRTAAAIRAWDKQRFVAALARDPLAPILTDEQIQGFVVRHHALLAHLQALENTYGNATYRW